VILPRRSKSVDPQGWAIYGLEFNFHELVPEALLFKIDTSEHVNPRNSRVAIEGKIPLAAIEIIANKESMKILGWILLILGALDLAQWVWTGFSYGWTNIAFGDNVFTQYGPWFAVATGYLLIALAGQREKAAVQMALAEVGLPAGETALYRENSAGLVLSMTNQRLMVKGIGWNTFRHNPGAKVHNFPPSDEFELRLDEIADLRPVRFPEVTSSKIAAFVGQFVTRSWGISASLKNGQVLNFPVRNPELLAAHFQKLRVL
jgi:hypothetical protein